jgi:hypothetical protein
MRHGRVAACRLLAGAALVMVAAGPALAQNEPVRIFNRTALPAVAVHVMRSGQAAWSANLLRSDPLAPGQFLSVRLGEGAGCRFDLRMVLQDGREILRQDADVCATRSVDIALETAPPAAPPVAPPLPQVGGPDRVLPPTEGSPRP